MGLEPSPTASKTMKPYLKPLYNFLGRRKKNNGEKGREGGGVPDRFMICFLYG